MTDGGGIDMGDEIKCFCGEVISKIAINCKWCGMTMGVIIQIQKLSKQVEKLSERIDSLEEQESRSATMEGLYSH